MRSKKLKRKKDENLLKLKEDIKDLERYIEEFSSFLPLPVCSLNPLGNIIDANLAFQRLSGYNLVEIVGQPLDTFLKEKETIKKIIEEIKEKEIIEAKELIFITKTQKEIPINLSISARKDKEGMFIGSFVGIFNISELKKLQEELEEKVKERTKELQERVNELEKLHKLTVGRELKMIELKQEIEKLKKELEKVEKIKNNN